MSPRTTPKKNQSGRAPGPPYEERLPVPVERNTSVTRAAELFLPRIVLEAGPDAARSFLEFFTATIRNKNTREAYGRAVRDFLLWAEEQGVRELRAIQPLHVAAYIEKHPG